MEHWYTPDGVLVEHEGPSKALIAREGLVPSVTTILGIIANPKLNKWIMGQVAERAGENPRFKGEPAYEYSRRILEDYEKHSSIALDDGKVAHEMMHSKIIGAPVPGASPAVVRYTQAAFEYLMKNLDYESIACEQFVRGKGYAGTTDLIGTTVSGKQAIVDYKTQKVKSGKPTFYNKFLYQIAAYAVATFGAITDDTVGISLVLNKSGDGEPVYVKTYGPEALKRGFRIFRMAQEIFNEERG